jgi:hypothetical protein
MPNILSAKKSNVRGSFNTFEGSPSLDNSADAGATKPKSTQKTGNVQDNLENLKMSLKLTNKSLRVSRRDLSSEISSRRINTDLSTV